MRRRRPKKSGPAGNYAGRAESLDALAATNSRASCHHRSEQEIDDAPKFYRR